MRKAEAATEHNRSLFINILVVAIILSLAAVFMHYLNKGSPDIRRLSLTKLADSFSQSVVNVHWQWQAEGRPEQIKLVTYANQLSGDKQLLELDKQVVYLNKQGWPQVSNSAAGCAEIWKVLLGVPLKVEGVELDIDFYAGKTMEGKESDYTCRYGLSKEVYFEYKLHSGHVLKV